MSAAAIQNLSCAALRQGKSVAHILARYVERASAKTTTTTTITPATANGHAAASHTSLPTSPSIQLAGQSAAGAKLAASSNNNSPALCNSKPDEDESASVVAPLTVVASSKGQISVGGDDDDSRSRSVAKTSHSPHHGLPMPDPQCEQGRLPGGGGVCRYIDAFTLPRAASPGRGQSGSPSPGGVVPLAAFYARFEQAARVDPAVLVASVVLLFRAASNSRGHKHTQGADCPARRKTFAVTPFNVHRLALASIVIAVKMFGDEYYAIPLYAKIAGVSTSLLLELEMVFFSLLGYDASVSAQAFALTCYEAAGGGGGSVTPPMALTSPAASPAPGVLSISTPSTTLSRLRRSLPRTNYDARDDGTETSTAEQLSADSDESPNREAEVIYSPSSASGRLPLATAIRAKTLDARRGKYRRHQQQEEGHDNTSSGDRARAAIETKKVLRLPLDARIPDAASDNDTTDVSDQDGRDGAKRHNGCIVVPSPASKAAKVGPTGSSPPAPFRPDTSAHTAPLGREVAEAGITTAKATTHTKNIKCRTFDGEARLTSPKQHRTEPEEGDPMTELDARHVANAVRTSTHHAATTITAPWSEQRTFHTDDSASEEVTTVTTALTQWK